MSDDECIALAALHGAEIYQAGGFGRWYLRGVGTSSPYARAHVIGFGTYGNATRAGQARFYCEFHKLLPEVTDEDVPV